MNSLAVLVWMILAVLVWAGLLVDIGTIKVWGFDFCFVHAGSHPRDGRGSQVGTAELSQSQNTFQPRTQPSPAQIFCPVPQG